MLTHLTIKNYALIRELDISISEGFLVITGETGAGKSILLGALSLILGQRADNSLLTEKDKKCIVEGTFRITGYGLEPVFATNDIDWQEITLLRREINPNGISRAFINDTPVTLSFLKELGEKMVNIHSQYQTLTLNDTSFQLTVVDTYAGINDQVDTYRLAFDRLVQIKTAHHRLLDQEIRSKADLDYYQFLHDELEKAQLVHGEQVEIERELQLLSNAEEIKSNLFNAAHSLLHHDQNVMDQLRLITQGLARSTRFYPDIQSLVDRLDGAGIELKDIAQEIEHMENKLTCDPQRMVTLSERLDLINKLEHKHHVGSVAELISLREEFAVKLHTIHSMVDDIHRLEKEILSGEAELSVTASAISDQRKSVISMIEAELIHMLNDLGMPDAQFRIDCSPASGLSRDGMDVVTFLFNANRGGEMKEISTVASGGERSRLMLSLKSLIARKNLLPTIIFDEIDIGVSGEVAGKMGLILKRMAEYMQVIVITHLPQIAGKGDVHYLVYKEADIFNTQTFLRKLSADERIQEIAKMLSDQKVTDSAMMAARELLKDSI